MPMPQQPHPHSGRFKVKNAILVARDDLYWEHLDEFESACDMLLDSPGDRLVVDLSSVAFISSEFVDGIGSLVVKAVRKRKKVVIRVSSDASWIFEVMGSQGLFEMEVV